MTEFKYADFATWWDQQTDIDDDSEALARRIFKAGRATERAARATPADPYAEYKRGLREAFDCANQIKYNRQGRTAEETCAYIVRRLSEYANGFSSVLSENEGRATPADQEPIHMISPALHSGHWIETDAEHYKDYTDDYRRIVYAQPPKNAADHIVDANKKVDAQSVPVAEMPLTSGAGPQKLAWFKHPDSFAPGTKLYAQPPQNAADRIEAQSVPVVDDREALTDEVVEGWLDRVGNDRGQGLHPIYTSGVREGYRLARSTLTDLYAARAAAQQAPQSDAQSVRDAWISVDERLPEQHEWVLVSDGTWSAIGMHLDDEDLEPNKRWMDESAELIESNGIKITHWQPLPQPPKG